MTKKNFISVGILLMLVLTACTTPTSVTTQIPVPTTGQAATQYPVPPIVNSNNSSYPNPQINPTAVVIAKPTYTPDPTMGLVTGKLLLKNEAVGGVLLYLAEVMKDKTGKDIVAGLDRVNSPNIRTDAEGKFSFINVSVGRYAMILDVVTNQYMINYPDKDTPIIIDVAAGKVIDLGNMNYDTLPLPPK